MQTHNDPDSRTTSTPSTPPQHSSMRWVFWSFIAIAAYLLWTEHRAHLLAGLSWLPYLLILACPLLHVFMHRGHGGHGASTGTDATHSRRED
jgi:hypothetical protein